MRTYEIFELIVRPTCVCVIPSTLAADFKRRSMSDEQKERMSKARDDRDLEKEVFINKVGEDAWEGIKFDLSPDSQRKLKHAISTLAESAYYKKIWNEKRDKFFTFKLNFVTLTLAAPQGDILDKEIHKECFKPFIKDLVRNHSLNLYVYKAESQANNNLHYHLTTDTFLHHSTLRKLWNHYQNKLGFIDKFKRKWKHSNPNSTDIHATYKIEDIEAYLVKYMIKSEEEKRKVKMRRWGCSKPLAYSKRLRCTLEPDLNNEMVKLEKEIGKKVIDEDYYMVYPFKKGFLKSNKYPNLAKRYNEWLDEIRGHEIPEKMPEYQL